MAMEILCKAIIGGGVLAVIMLYVYLFFDKCSAKGAEAGESNKETDQLVDYPEDDEDDEDDDVIDVDNDRTHQA